MQVYRDASIPYFKINAPFFCSPLVFEDLNPQVRINEMVSEYSVDYNPCPEGFILSCITTPWRFISLQNFYWFLSSKAYFPSWLAKIFNFMFRLLENAFASQKVKSRHFCYVPQVLIITPEAEGDHSLRPESVFFLTPLPPSPSRKRGRRGNYGGVQEWQEKFLRQYLLIEYQNSDESRDVLVLDVALFVLFKKCPLLWIRCPLFIAQKMCPFMRLFML